MNRITVDGDLVLKTVVAVQEQLLAATTSPYDLEIEFLNISKWDVSGIQLLYALKKQQESIQKKVVFSFVQADQAKLCQDMIDLLKIITP